MTELPREVQNHIIKQMLRGNDVEIRMAQGKLKVFTIRKQMKEFLIPGARNPDNNKHDPSLTTK